MSSISSVGGTSGSSPSISSPHSSRGAGHAKQFEQDLAKYLTEQGVSADDQATIKSELQAAIKANFNSGSRPDLSKIADSIKSVLDKHGVDGAAFIKQLPKPPAGGAGGPGGGDKDKAATELDYLKKLLDALVKQAEKSQKQLLSSATADSKSATSNTTSSSSTPSTGKLDIQI